MDRSAVRKAPSEGFVVELDGQFISEYGSITAALNAGLTLKQRAGGHEVRVRDAQEGAPEIIEPPVFHWWMALDEVPKDEPTEFHWG